MPGNDVYVDFGPGANITKAEAMFSNNPGMVSISSARPPGRVLPGSYSAMSTLETEALLKRAYQAQRDAYGGLLLYNALDFNMNDTSNPAVTNCRGFASGL